MNEDTVQCPCYSICSTLGLEIGPWCRYHSSDLPPPGMHKFDPKDTWCPPGVQAAVLMLGHLAARQNGPAEPLDSALEKVRAWAQALPARRGG